MPEMKNKITLNIDHPNAKRMEFFLNAVEEDLIEIPFEWKKWKLSDRMSGGCKFISKDKSLTITVLFCDSYHDANEIAAANDLPYLPKAKWSLNGNLLYLVESDDEGKVREVLGLFAGEE